MKIDLSIIIPVYEAKKTIQSAIESINKQKNLINNFKIELILIVDDGRKYESIIPELKSGIKIKLLKTKGIKTGPGNARNVGIKEAKGKYIGFLDADDEWSNKYVYKMFNLVKKQGVAFAPSRVYENNKLMHIFSGEEEGCIKLSDIGKIPCSFHPFILNENVKEFKKIKSQDVYNIAYILAKKNKKIKMITDDYYKINIQEKSVTKENGFSHKITIAYKQYQQICKKEGVPNVGRQFAIRRINNIKYNIWKIDNNGGYYEYLSEKMKKNKKRK
jgi:glycosyltransferase involved in cell wall biosynthesis